MENQPNNSINKMADKFSYILERFESFFALSFIACITLRLTTALPISMILVLSLGTLAMLYYLSAFATMNTGKEVNTRDRFTKKFSGMAPAIGVLGILFCIMGWPGYKVMSLVGCGGCLLLLPLILSSRSKDQDTNIFSMRLVIRLLVIGMLGLLLLATSKETLIKMKLVKERKANETEQQH